LCCAVHCRYYLNGVDAFRLKLLLPLTQQQQDEIAARELETLSVSNGGNAAAAAEPTSAGNTQVEQQRVQAPDESSQGAQEHTSEGQSSQRSQSQKDADSSLLQKFDALRT